WQQVRLQRVDRFPEQERRAALGKHDRVDDELPDAVPLERVRDSLRQLRRIEHPGLDRVRSDIEHYRIDLLDDGVDRHRIYPVDADAVLRGNRRYGRHAEYAELLHRLQVRLYAGAAAGIRSGDRQRPGKRDRPRRPVPVTRTPNVGHAKSLPIKPAAAAETANRSGAKAVSGTGVASSPLSSAAKEAAVTGASRMPLR